MYKTGYENALKRSLTKYKRRQAAHYAVMVLYLGVVVGRPAAALLRNAHHYRERLVPLLLLTALFFVLPVSLYSWYLWIYHKAIARLAAGNVLEITGEIVTQKGNRCTLRETLPENLRRSSFQHLTRTRTFYLPKHSREREFQPGEKITLYYPASRILWQGMPEAIWAESS